MVPSYDKVIESVKSLHYQLPYFNLAGWDIVVGEDGDPVFIECNSRAELNQTAAGLAFGEYILKKF